jgi:hypothetical protein
VAETLPTPAQLPPPVHDGVVTAAQLRAIMGMTVGKAIARRLERQGVRVFWGKDGPWTTLAALQAASAPTAANEPLRPEDVL